MRLKPTTKLFPACSVAVTPTRKRHEQQQQQQQQHLSTPSPHFCPVHSERPPDCTVLHFTWPPRNARWLRESRIETRGPEAEAEDDTPTVSSAEDFRQHAFPSPPLPSPLLPLLPSPSPSALPDSAQPLLRHRQRKGRQCHQEALRSISRRTLVEKSLGSSRDVACWGVWEYASNMPG